MTKEAPASVTLILFRCFEFLSCVFFSILFFESKLHAFLVRIFPALPCFICMPYNFDWDIGLSKAGIIENAKCHCWEFHNLHNINFMQSKPFNLLMNGILIPVHCESKLHQVPQILFTWGFKYIKRKFKSSHHFSESYCNPHNSYDNPSWKYSIIYC